MNRHAPHTEFSTRRHGSVLIAVLIVIVVLTLVAYRFTDAMTAQRRAAQRTADAAQARAAAVSGVHYAASSLADPDTFFNVLGGDPTQTNDLFADQVYWTDPNSPKRQARFQIVAVAPLSQGGFERRNAAVDEGGKLNINAMILQDPTGVALYNALLQIPNMTPEIAANIVDWVDEDDEPGQASNGEAQGAESSAYASLGYQAKNGPLNTLDELLLVAGVTPQLLYGTDQNQNGVADAGEGDLDRGWSAYLTVYGRELNVDSTGRLRIYINGDQNADDLRNIYQAMLDGGIDREMAAFIVGVKLYGTRNLMDPSSLQSSSNTNPVQGGIMTSGTGGITLKVTTGGATGQAGQGGQGGSTPPPPPTVLDSQAFIDAVEKKLASATGNGQQVNSISQLAGKYLQISAASGKNGATIFYSPLNNPDRMAQLLGPLMDKVATKEEVELIPRLNVNVAPREVIAGLPGLEASDVDAIMAAREGRSQAALDTTGAWMVAAAGLTPQKFQALEKYVTGTSMVYRVQVVGYISGGGPVSRLEAVIDTNLGSPRILYFRDLGDLDNPRGFPHPDKQTAGGQ